LTIPVHAPYLILAGDIERIEDYDQYLDLTLVFLVEFYGILKERGLELAGNLEQEERLDGRLRVLHRRIVDITESEVTILECTLQSHIPDEKGVIGGFVKDFSRIGNWTIDNHNREHTLDVTWLKTSVAEIRTEDEAAGQKRRKKVMVVTHHAPTTKVSSSPKDEGNSWSCAFGMDVLVTGGKGWDGDGKWGGVK